MSANLEVRDSHKKCWTYEKLPGVVSYNNHYVSKFVPHSHEFLTLVSVTSGAFRLQVDDFVARVEEGDFIAIGPNQIHGAQPVSKNGWSMRTLQIPVSSILPHELIKKRDGFTFGRPVLKSEADGASLFNRFQSNRALADEALAASEFIKLKSWFQLNLDKLDLAVSCRDETAAKFSISSDFIFSALCEGVPVEEIAINSGFTVFSFIRKFKKEHGVSPHAWRILKKIEDSTEFLRDGDPIAEIAYECGFSDQAHFCRAFKRVYGITPGQYRTSFDQIR